MRQIRIADGIALTEFALGDCKRGMPEHEARAFEVMDHYFARGGNTFDSARAYNDGGADRALGKWMRSRGIDRDAVTIVTKGSQMHTKYIPRLSKAEIEQDLHESLDFIGTPYSDLHILHRDDVTRPVEEIMPVLDGLVKAGKARAVGASNWTVSRIIQANEFALTHGMEPLRCSQVLYSLAQTTPAATGDLSHVIMNDVELNWYRESQLPMLCFGTQARGWFAVRARGEEPTQSPRTYYDHFPENHRRLIRLGKLAASIGQPMQAITAAYVRDHGYNAAVLVSFSSIRQADEVLAAESFRLTREQIRYLETGVGSC